MQFAFCLEMLFKELPFLDRLLLARDEGIDNIEFWDWRDKDLSLLAQLIAKHQMRVTNISGNRRYGMIDQCHRQPFLAEVAETAQVAEKLGCPRLMLLVQTLNPDGSAVLPQSELPRSKLIEQIVSCGLELTILSEKLNLEFVIEPLNSAIDHPGYFLDSSKTAFEIIDEIHHPRVKVLFDIYHMAVMGEDYLRAIEKHIDRIGYFHVADTPGRGEPGSGKIRYKHVLSLLRHLDYRGFVGFEYCPSRGLSHDAIRETFKIFELMNYRNRTKV
jgi:hydroxypyruvate isomerase